MPTNISLRESVAEAPVKNGKRWRVIVARPGQGSSGKYSEELFRRDGHKIIAPGGQMFLNHDDTRNPKDMIGVYPEGSFWDEDEKAVVSEVEVFSHWESFVDEVGPHCGVSLYALGEQDDEGNVTAILEDRLNGADLVSRPGLIGSGLAEKLYESAVSHSVTEPTATSAGDRKEAIMPDNTEIVSAIEALTAKVTELVAANKIQAEEAAKVEADAEAIAAAVEAYDAAVKAVDEADLLAPQRESILEAAKRGENVEARIAEAKTVKEAAIEAAGRMEESAGRSFGNSTTKFGAWK